MTTATDALPPVPTASGALGTRTSTAYVEADEPVVLVGSNATCETVPSITGMPVTVTRAACPTAIAARLAAGTWMVTFAAPDPPICMPFAAVAVAPTAHAIEPTRPAIGAASVAAARLVWAFTRAASALVTLARSVMSLASDTVPLELRLSLIHI